MTTLKEQIQKLDTEGQHDSLLEFCLNCFSMSFTRLRPHAAAAVREARRLLKGDEVDEYTLLLANNAYNAYVNDDDVTQPGGMDYICAHELLRLFVEIKKKPHFFKQPLAHFNFTSHILWFLEDLPKSQDNQQEFLDLLEPYIEMDQHS
jgi:hypothetical protein